MAESPHELTDDEAALLHASLERSKHRLSGQRVLFGRLSDLSGFVLDELEGDSRGGPWRVWLAGVALPAVLAFYAARILLSGNVYIPQLPLFAFPPGQPVAGAAATWEALALLAWGLFLNVQFFWCSRERLRRYYEPAKLVAALLAVAATGGFVYRYVVS